MTTLPVRNIQFTPKDAINHMRRIQELEPQIEGRSKNKYIWPEGAALQGKEITGQKRQQPLLAPNETSADANRLPSHNTANSNLSPLILGHN